ncbi:MAG: LPS export ABC transporter permease LptG [Neisseriaceae bacterium]|nr:LPS export ABC transporter permease LptG [Neisseriaceae bacterium]
MSTLRYYLLGRFLATSFFILLCLLGLYALFDVFAELGDLGKENYTVTAMSIYIALLAPAHAYQLMPLIVLIGVLVAMSQLSKTVEYTAIRVSGVSLFQIALTMLWFGLVAAILAMALGEWLMPWAEETAKMAKLKATGSMVSQTSNTGFWAKDKQDFINVRQVNNEGDLNDIRILTYDVQNRLISSKIAQKGHYLPEQKAWHLEHVQTSFMGDHAIDVIKEKTVVWKTHLQPNILSVLTLEPEQMAAFDLYQYIGHLKENNQKTIRYEIALWRKLFYPFACVIMALIALAFTPLNQRNGEMGSKLFFGILLGISFHFLNSFFGDLGVQYNWSPAMVATLPSFLFLLAGVYVIHWQERK